MSTDDKISIDYSEGYTQYNFDTGKYETISVGDRVQIHLVGSDEDFLKGYNIVSGHICKIVEIKRIREDSGRVIWKIYARNPLWNYAHPDHDPTVMEFFPREIVGLSVVYSENSAPEEERGVREEMEEVFNG